MVMHTVWNTFWEKKMFKKLEGNSYSPVHCACFSGSEMCLEHLITHFGDAIVHLKDDKQRTPMHIAALHGHSECARLLLKHGAEPHVVDEEGRTPLVAAAQYGQTSVIELLLTCNINLSACDNDGNTALHWACLNKHHQTALLILENCHDAKLVDLANNERKTALHLAARNGLVNVTRELLKKGANVLVVDNEGLTPALCCAPSYNVAQCLALILQTLPDFLGKAAQEDNVAGPVLPPVPPPSPKPVKNSHCQTNVVLVNDPDLFELKNAFVPSKEHKISRPVISVDSTNDYFIKESNINENQGVIPKIPVEKGKKLHRSGKELNIPNNELLFVKHRRKSSRNLLFNQFSSSLSSPDKVLSCKECQKFQKQCLNCQIHEEVKMAKRKQPGEKTTGSQSQSSALSSPLANKQSLWFTKHSLSRVEQTLPCKGCKKINKKCPNCKMSDVLKMHVDGDTSYEELTDFLSTILSEASDVVKKRFTRTVDLLKKNYKFELNRNEPIFEKENIFGVSEIDIDFGKEFDEKICQEMEKNIQKCQNNESQSLECDRECQSLKESLRTFGRDEDQYRAAICDINNDVKVLYLKNEKGNSRCPLNLDNQCQILTNKNENTDNISKKFTEHSENDAAKTSHKKKLETVNGPLETLFFFQRKCQNKSGIPENTDGNCQKLEALLESVEKRSKCSQTELFVLEPSQEQLLSESDPTLTYFDVSSDDLSQQNDSLFDLNSLNDGEMDMDDVSVRSQDFNEECQENIGSASQMMSENDDKNEDISRVLSDVTPTNNIDCEENDVSSNKIEELEANITSQNSGDIDSIFTQSTCENNVEENDIETLIALKKRSRRADVSCSVC